MTRLAFLAPLLACGFALAGPAPAARAGLLPVNWSVTPEAGKYRWTYAVVLPTDALIRSGDYFTIYDFAGFNPGSNGQPTDWQFTTSQVGPVPPGVDPTDDPALPNLTWKYTGPDQGSGQVGLGNFWAVSDFQSATDSYFTASTHRTSDGKRDANITPTTVPVPTAGPQVPEPATLALAGVGLPLVGFARWVRRR